jgi:hypothetical protein
MVLSRFWLIIFISSLVFILVGVSFNQQYSIDSVINGKKDDPFLIGEKYLFQLPKALKDTLKISPEGTVVFNVNELDADTTYVNSERRPKNRWIASYSEVYHPRYHSSLACLFSIFCWLNAVTD